MVPQLPVAMHTIFFISSHSRKWSPRLLATYWVKVGSIRPLSSRIGQTGEGQGASQVALVVKTLPAYAGDMRDRFDPLSWEDPLEEGMATHSILLPEESNGQRSLAGCSL